MSDEVETAMYTRIGAWHGKGNVKATAPTLEEALILSGLNWTASRRPIFDGNGSRIEGYYAVTRDTDASTLGVVQSRYTILQNKDAFAHFAPLIDSGAWEIDAAGSLRGGKRIWILARVKGLEADVANNDTIRPYYMLTHGHDGLAMVDCRFTGIRVVCMNTLRMAQGANTPHIRLKHTRGIHEALDIVRDTIDVTRQTFNVTVEQYRAMAKIGMDSASFRSYVRKVFEVPEAEEKMPRAFETLEGLFEGEAIGSRLAGSTVWGGYNAITQWIDHARGRTDESRFEAAHFGAGAQLRNKAFDEAVALLQ